MLWLWGGGDFYQARLFPAYIDMVGFALIRYLWWFYILPKHLTADVRSLLLLENENLLCRITTILDLNKVNRMLLLPRFWLERKYYFRCLKDTWKLYLNFLQYIQVLKTTGTVKNRQAQRFFFILYCYHVFTSKDQNMMAQKSQWVATSLHRS